MGPFAGETGALTFKLVSRGAVNAQVVIEQIDLTSSNDPDYDGLTNAQEVALGTNAHSYDTDGDGLNDAEELSDYATIPLLADTDGDGVEDADEVTAGSNPLDVGSAFRVMAVQRLRWPLQTGPSIRPPRTSLPAFRRPWLQP